jgi:hypothetical protein
MLSSFLFLLDDELDSFLAQEAARLVTPAKAGVQNARLFLDSGFHPPQADSPE